MVDSEYSIAKLMKKNPALRQEPRYEPAAVIPLRPEPSLMDWLKMNNRLIPREVEEIPNQIDDDREILQLMDAEEQSYKDDEE